MKEQIWNEFFTNGWMAANGLARLVHKDKEFKNTDFPIYDQLGLETVKNDNGILFLAYFLALSHLNGLKSNIYTKQYDVGSTIERLSRIPYRGLFNRQPSGSLVPNKLEAHDNYVGICFISRLLGLSYQTEIVSYGVKHGWNYNNIDPLKYDTKTQRQPGESAFYLLCDRSRPDFIGFIYMLIGIIINAFKKNAGQNNLTWLRLYTLNMVEYEQNIIVRFCILITSCFWNFMMLLTWGSLKEMFSAYFGKNHPISKMAGLMPEDHWGV